MKILCVGNENIKKQLSSQNFMIDCVLKLQECLNMCASSFYDIVIIDIENDFIDAVKLITVLRSRRVYTPILILYDKKQKNIKNQCLVNGADNSLSIDEMDDLNLVISIMHRRNTEFQSPTINYCDIYLNKSEGKICYGDTSLSVSPIEIEIFRLLTRTNKPISINKLSKKMNEINERVAFAGDCLQKKIGLLQCPIKLEIKNGTCQLKNIKLGQL